MLIVGVGAGVGTYAVVINKKAKSAKITADKVLKDAYAQAEKIKKEPYIIPFKELEGPYELPFEEDEKSANDIFSLAANHIVEMYITASSVRYIYHLLEKNLNSNDTAKQMLGKLYTLAHILEVTEADCKEALRLDIANYELYIMLQFHYNMHHFYNVPLNIVE